MIKTDFDPFPILTSNRLLLRAVELEDAQTIYEMRSDERVMQFIDIPRAKSIQDGINKVNQIKKMIENQEAINWTITLQGNSKSIGNIGFWKFAKESRRVEIGYMLHPDYFRKGIMTEAMQIALKYAFEEMDVHSVEARIQPENIPSIGVATKNGFEKEGHLRENYYFNGKFLDTAIYGLLKREWSI